MGHFYFIRHGETFWNVDNKICGTTDIGLTDKGFDQARQSAEAMLKEGITADMIISSPLIRAADTAREISRLCNIPMRTDERLTEQCFGCYEGTARDGQEFHEAKKRFADRYENGESMLQTAHRVYGLLDEITSQEDTVYILVAHNGLARIIQSYFTSMTNEEFASFGIPNCAVMRFDY